MPIMTIIECLSGDDNATLCHYGGLRCAVTGTLVHNVLVLLSIFHMPPESLC
jgi:hypothetical protein